MVCKGPDSVKIQFKKLLSQGPDCTLKIFQSNWPLTAFKTFDLALFNAFFPVYLFKNRFFENTIFENFFTPIFFSNLRVIASVKIYFLKSLSIFRKPLKVMRVFERKIFFFNKKLFLINLFKKKLVQDGSQLFVSI